jgi:hypothetical protein
MTAGGASCRGFGCSNQIAMPHKSRLTTKTVINILLFIA